MGSKAIYDYTSINLASVNRQTDRDPHLRVHRRSTRILLDTPMQTLALEGAFFREDSQRYARNILGILNANGQLGASCWSTSIPAISTARLNPYFLKPYLGFQDQPITFQQPAKWDTYRLELAYKIDFTHQEGQLDEVAGSAPDFSAYDDYASTASTGSTASRTPSRIPGKNHTWIPKRPSSTGNQGAIPSMASAAALAITCPRLLPVLMSATPTTPARSTTP